jgi:predicted lipoprotein
MCRLTPAAVCSIASANGQGPDRAAARCNAWSARVTPSCGAASRNVVAASASAIRPAQSSGKANGLHTAKMAANSPCRRPGHPCIIFSLAMASIMS